MSTDKPDLPAFDPRFTDTPGMGMYYEDGRILGAVDTYDLEDGGKKIVISEWSSEFRDQGCSVQALQWFREQGFSTIVANGVGELDDDMVGDIATNYWGHMHSKGLVDVLLDDNGRALAVDAQKNLSYAPDESGKASLRP